MSKKRNKFDLTHLVHVGSLKNSESLFFVSDPRKSCRIAKQPNGEYKVIAAGETMTVHHFVETCLGQEPVDHASKWLRTEKGITLFDIWHADDLEEAA